MRQTRARVIGPVGDGISGGIGPLKPAQVGPLPAPVGLNPQRAALRAQRRRVLPNARQPKGAGGAAKPYGTEVPGGGRNRKLKGCSCGGACTGSCRTS